VGKAAHIVGALAGLLALGVPVMAEAQVVRVVDRDGHGTAASCDDSAAALTSVTAGIAAAANGDTVLVCPGTYVENLNFAGKSIAVRSKSGPAVTILDGGQSESVVSFTTGEGAASVLEGFTVTHGRSGFDTAGFGNGGGVRIENSSPTIRANIIVNNRGCAGIGIFVRFGSPMIDSNVISNNVQAGCGGGTGGGGIGLLGTSAATIVGNLISGNVMTAGDGGGIALNGSGPRIERNVISGNSASGLSPCASGGGISIVNESPTSIAGNLIVKNSAGCGGGIFWLIPELATPPRIVSNTIADNGGREGSAIFADGFDGEVVVANNIIVAAAGQIAIECGNFNDSAPPTFTANDVFSASGLGYGGVCADQTGIRGNISADPFFADPAAGNYHLRTESLVIDAADGSILPALAVDLDNHPRPVDGDADGVAASDVGAFEAPAGVGARGGIAGTVTDAATHAAIASMTVRLYSTGGALVKSATTNGAGSFTVSGLLPGTYYVRTRASLAQNYIDESYNDVVCLTCPATTGQPVAVAAAAVTTGIDFALNAGATISGIVRAQSSSVLFNGVQIEVRATTGVVVKRAVTMTGAYQISGLPGGTYYVRAIAPLLDSIYPPLRGYVDQVYNNIPCLNCPATAGTPVVIGGGSTLAGIDFALSTGGVITGMVTDITTGVGLPNVAVEAYASDGRLGRAVVTPDGGFFTIDGLPPGTYYAKAVPVASTPYDQMLFDDLPCHACSPLSGTPITVTQGAQSGGVNFALRPRAPASVVGRTRTFTVDDASTARWASVQVVAGRSYCAILTPAETATNRAAPTLTAAIYQPHLTQALGTSSGQLCFVAPATDTVSLKVTQTDQAPRSYRLTVLETTLWANWFFIGGDYSSYTLLRNTSPRAVNLVVTWRNAAGVAVATDRILIPARGSYFRDARIAATTGTPAGSVDVAHDGDPSALVGSQTTLSATAGLSFDAVLLQRRPR
jgi:hypothetical protein